MFYFIKISQRVIVELDMHYSEKAQREYRESPEDIQRNP